LAPYDVVTVADERAEVERAEVERVELDFLRHHEQVDLSRAELGEEVAKSDTPHLSGATSSP